MEARHYKRTKHIDQKYYIIREAIGKRIVDVVKIASEDNLADPFTKSLTARVFDQHVEGMGLRCLTHLLH